VRYVHYLLEISAAQSDGGFADGFIWSRRTGSGPVFPGEGATSGVDSIRSVVIGS
jgi:hypothetical protein